MRIQTYPARLDMQPEANGHRHKPNIPCKSDSNYLSPRSQKTTCRRPVPSVRFGHSDAFGLTLCFPASAQTSINLNPNLSRRGPNCTRARYSSIRKYRLDSGIAARIYGSFAAHASVHERDSESSSSLSLRLCSTWWDAVSGFRELSRSRKPHVRRNGAVTQCMRVRGRPAATRIFGFSAAKCCREFVI